LGYCSVRTTERRRGDLVSHEAFSSAGCPFIISLFRLPDPHPVSPPELPETPLYPLLHTNTPVPSMTYPGFPFPPGTPLYPSHEHIEAYHQRYAWHFNLTQHIRFNHTVVASSWTAGRWHITFHDHKGQTRHKVFDHLVVASGHNNIPHIPVWRGQKEWLGNIPAKGLKREILHSIWYREPQKYANRSVVVVGSGASGRDAASQISSIAQKVSLKLRTGRGGLKFQRVVDLPFCEGRP
jgi:cation diffusion facilitator CzcD-associated flavoprotein CzcO